MSILFSALSNANVGIVLSSASGNATVHSTVLLVCVAGGNVTPEVTWHFNGSSIQTNVSSKVKVYLITTSCMSLSNPETAYNMGLEVGAQY